MREDGQKNLLIELLTEKKESLERELAECADREELESLRAENESLKAEATRLKAENAELWKMVGAAEIEDSPIERLPLLTKGTENALKKAGIYGVRSLCSRSEADLRALPRIGNQAMEEIKGSLEIKGLSLRGQ